MAQAPQLYQRYFLEYASYVIRDRAIPDLVDGLKPVQRRILHSLFEMDDGKFHKVANVVGWAMRYHPHGDAAIYEALVNLANHDLFIERQGNFGNEMTGDHAAAARYIECRLLPFAKLVLYNPELTTYVDSYDGRNKEPVTFPAKIPVVLIQGVQGIAVGMSTMILPHNAIEVLEAMKSAINNQPFTLYPDFPGGGIVDVKEYDDGKGKVAVRAKLNISDPKRIVIEELPYGVTSEMMIDSVQKAAKDGKLKVASITDFTTDKVNIEIDLQRNTFSKDIVKSLYAYTLCETKISVNPLVIKDNMPVVMSVSEIIRYHASHLMDVLRQELELKKRHLLEDLQARTLERIFVEERIYKRIETKKTAEDVEKAVVTGFKPFEEQLLHPITHDDVERLLKIPIRRISLFDISKNHEEIDAINNGLKDVEAKLADLKGYSLGYIDMLKSSLGIASHRRKTTVKSFETVDVKEVAQRNLSLTYDPVNGYLGTAVKDGSTMLSVSEFDRVLVIRKDGSYMVIDAPEKEFVGKGMLYCGFADKDELEKIVFTILYREKKTKFLFLKRCRITSFQLKKLYLLLPDDTHFQLLKLSTLPNAELKVVYKPKPGMRIKEETFYFGDYAVRGSKAGGYRLTVKEIESLKLRAVKEVVTTESQTPTLFDDADGGEETDG
ncbi:MAG: DNA topoisomerase IV subunit A [Sphaerochaeta sp.]|jgi:topoisomerase-4 subunit A|nr:DNA topoisomerase IV subunit A [Sphaerochaeta sp.]